MNKIQITKRKMNPRTISPKFCFAEFSTFLKNSFFKISLASRTNCNFGFARCTSRPFPKTKLHFSLTHLRIVLNLHLII